MSLDELPAEILDSVFGLIFDESQVSITARRHHQPTVGQPSDQYDPLTLRLVCRRCNGIVLERISHELRRVRRTQNTERIPEVFEYLAASLLAWEVGFDRKDRWSGKEISRLYKAIRLTAQAVAKLKPGVDVQAQKERYWAILARRAEMHMALRHVLLFKECDDLQPDSFRDVDLALIVAAADGDMKFVRWLLNRANPTVHPYFGNSLHAAMGRRNSNAATLLVDRGARVHGVDKYAPNALHLAAINGHASAARSLRDIFDLFPPVMRADPNVLDAQLRIPLIWASIMGHTDVVSTLVSRRDCDVNVSDRDSHTALSWAICKGNVDVVNALIVRRDLDVQKVVGPQLTPTLVYAAELHQVNIIRNILYSHRIVNLDRVYAGKRTPMTQAILQHDREIVQLLIDSKRVDVNAYDGHGREWTPLRMACEFFNEDAVDRLFATGVINVHDNMHLAIQRDSWEMLWELVPRLDININHITMLQFRDQFTSKSILGEAASRGNYRFVRYILQCQPDCGVKIACTWDQTPLTRAVYNGHLAVVRQLLNRDDVDVNRTYGDQLPALSWAIHLKRKKAVKLLLAKSEIDIHLLHENGSPYQLAQRSASTTVRKLLRDHDLRLKGQPLRNNTDREDCGN